MKFSKTNLGLLLLLLLFTGLTFGQSSSFNGKEKLALKHLPFTEIYDTIKTKNIIEWCSNFGLDSYDPRTGGSGFYWPLPNQLGQTLIFSDGLQWGGLASGEIRIGGAFFYSLIGNTPLVIDSTDTGKVYSGIWKIRKNWEDFPEGEFKERLKHDYENWPVELGAPWEDVDGDGKFTRGVDKPKFFGDEQLYRCYQGGDTNRLYSRYNVPPFHLEVHELIYAFDSTNFLQDVIFKRFEIINKDTVTLKDFYATYWADDDLGMANDDYEGCDSNLYLGYEFNAFDDGDYYYKPVAPAIGHAVLKGLTTKDGKNLMMTAFGPNFKLSMNSSDPGDSLEYYNVIRGLLNDGEPFRNPFSDEPSRFPMSGDPDAQIGWFEGVDWPPSTTFGHGAPYPSDRRYYICSGPIDFAPGDTQTVVIAEIVAIGNSNVNSVTELRKKTLKVQHFYGNTFITANNDKPFELPKDFKLFQSYPNPIVKEVAKEATIKFSLPAESRNVRLTVYNLLGQKVAEPFNGTANAGLHSVKLNTDNLSSGVYFYRLTTPKFSAIKKMLVLK